MSLVRASLERNLKSAVMAERYWRCSPCGDSFKVADLNKYICEKCGYCLNCCTKGYSIDSHEDSRQLSFNLTYR